MRLVCEKVKERQEIEEEKEKKGESLESCSGELDGAAIRVLSDGSRSALDSCLHSGRLQELHKLRAAKL